MLTHKLEKNVILYKNQFEKFALDIFGDNRLDRYSLELDGILFRIKYMYKHNKDTSNIESLRNDFTNKTIQIRNAFSEFTFNLITQIIGINDPFKLDDIVDVLAQDVEMDPTYVKFKMIVISSNKNFLNHIDNSFEDENVWNIFPNEYFRFYTDSYNDGISKAFPELFENRQQTEIGTGDDHDVFVHNFTFQTSEKCSLNCFTAGTKILMADLSEKNIEDIKFGDEVLGFAEFKTQHEYSLFSKTYVTSPLVAREAKVYKLTCEKAKPLIVTAEHPMLTWDHKWKQVKDLKPGDVLSRVKVVKENDKKNNGVISVLSRVLSIEELPESQMVYNFETFKHTYIANNIKTHNCTYCYQFNKSNMRMDFETAKEFIDNLLADKYGYINRYNSPAIIIEFIGGEPLLEINLTRKIYEYFLEQCYELNHPWFTLHRISICSNGLQYFDDEVQSFFKDYASQISFNISIDGNKELHDSCRIQPNGEGSYDICITALDHYNKHYSKERNSKMTLAPENISYLYDSVINFINNGMSSINLNCVFEEGWNQKTANIEYYQLKKLTDYIIDNNLEHIYLSIFNERQEDKYDKSYDGLFCGGQGSMLALRPNGQFYPCIRYMPTSVGNNVKDLCLGDVKTGMIGRDQGSEVLKLLDKITRRGQNNDICYECPLSNDCASCLALGHTVFGDPNKRTTFTCIQMIAEHLANVYYWNRIIIKHPEWDLYVRKNVCPDEWSLLVIDKKELEELKLLECSAMIKRIEYKNKEMG